MPTTKHKYGATRKFITQFSYAAIVVTGLWFAGVGFSRTVLARPLGGDESSSNLKQFTVGKGFKLPKGFVPRPGQTYIPGKNGHGPVLVYLHQNNAAFEWHAWMGALRIVLLIVVIASVLALIDRSLRAARRARVSG
jgi:hypothetical protein